MKDKLEPNMYVRTKYGISQYKYYDTSNGKLLCIPVKDGSKGVFANIEDISKASHNIIDLIEEDDLIKCQFGWQTLILQVGARYTTLYPENGFVKGVFTPDNEFWSLEVLVEEDILQSIVTKEQFESMEYGLGGK